MLADRDEDAVVIGEQAIALARQLNLPVVEAHALDTVGMARFSHGDPEGIKLVESSLELALAADSPEASRSLNNLSVATFSAGDARRAYELRRDSIAVDRKFGRDLMARFAEAGLFIHTYVDGDWDKFLEQAEQYALESARSGVNYSEIYLLGLAARIYVARGADADALAAAQTAVERARPINESQVLMPALSAKAWVDFVVGDHDGARAAIAELARAPRNTMLLDLIALSTGAKTLGIEDLIRQIIPRDAPASTWIDVVRAILGEDLVRAGDLLQAAGHVPDAALVRTEAADRLARAGRHGEADALIRQALPFWRSVRATRYIKRSESLLSRTA